MRGSKHALDVDKLVEVALLTRSPVRGSSATCAVTTPVSGAGAASAVTFTATVAGNCKPTSTGTGTATATSSGIVAPTGLLALDCPGLNNQGNQIITLGRIAPHRLLPSLLHETNLTSSSLVRYGFLALQTRVWNRPPRQRHRRDYCLLVPRLSTSLRSSQPLCG